MQFSDKIYNAKPGYTYDDFLLVPNASWIEAKDVQTKVSLTKDITLNIPIMSAAMDTVTEANLAIALAQEGGIGVIHRNITQEAQVEEVKRVKCAEDITVRDVVTISPESSIETVQDIMENESVSGLPVIENEKVVGIISKRDIRPFLKTDAKRLVRDIMTSDVVTIKEGITSEEALDIAYENKVERLPVVSEDGSLVGILTIKDILNQDQHPHAALDKKGKYLVAAACGPFDLDRAMALDQAGADIISIDCDGQDDIHAMDQMVEKYLEGNEIVYGVRSSRKTDTWFKRNTAQLYYKILEKLGGDIVYNHADYRLVSSRVLDSFADYHEVNLFLRGIFPLIGYQSATVEYERHERLAGSSHYPFSKMLKLAIDGITSLSTKPIKWIMTIGFFISLFGLLGIIWVFVRKLAGFPVSVGWSSIVCLILFLGGVQLLSTGVIGEYIGKTYLESKHRPRYIISERTWEKQERHYKG